MTGPKQAPFPTKEQIAAFIRESPVPVGKKEIARAFQMTGDQRIGLKALLKELEAEGTVERGPGRRLAPPRSLPTVTVVDVSDIDEDGETVARPVRWDGSGPAPRIFLGPGRAGHPSLAPGDRALVRLRRTAPDTYEAQVIRKLDRRDGVTRIVGTIESRRGGGYLVPADRRQKDGLFVAEDGRNAARDGELVVVETEPGGARLGARRGRVVERLGDPADPANISLIAIHAAGIPVDFPRAALEQAEQATLPDIGSRTDLRSFPLVTIDGADARDFDDAVWAEPDSSPTNPAGWHVIVAIADVAASVPPGSPLDREAFKRGNSCYFPDRVVPMLPEALSNGLCSLVPGQDRACHAVHLWIDADGQPVRHRFVRGIMRSTARLTYEQVQAARDGRPDEITQPLMDPVIAPLYGAYAALARARERRGTLELDLPEKVIRIGDDGRVAEIGQRTRLDSHRLIEEFMIAANVAAASTLQDRNHPCLFRVHDAPDPARVHALAEFLEPLGYSLAKGQVYKPRMFSHILQRAAGRPEAAVVSEMILRSQAQAVYAPENIGHFGLSLARYAHFTSPIRRYADLVVHRALIRLLGSGADGLTDDELQRLEAIGQQVSATERRAAMAERDSQDRYLAAFLSDRVGGIFSGRIGGVTRFGLFVTLDETGASGLVPVSTLPEDFYEHDAASHALVGRRWGRVFRLGARVRTRLSEADPITGSTVLLLLDADDGAESFESVGGTPAPAGRRPGRPGPRRPGRSTPRGPRGRRR